jgi:beta-fructofuranosidase
MDLYRPIYHFLPPSNWMNDPNGLLYYKGEYHLFYQYNPNGDEWGTIHWGHAKSKDMIRWEHLPIALSPSRELGEEHCFSGSAVINDEGVPTIFYTSIGNGERGYATGAEQWMATSADDMLTWQKHAGNPVLSKEVHGDLTIRDWRDPYVWKEGEQWLMVIGGEHNGKGCALIYRSENLTKWTFLNKLMEARHRKETLWECPIFFQLDGKYVLIYSPKDVVRYYTGTLNDDYTFTPEYEGIIDYSGWEGYYAPNVMKDGQGRTLMWGWMTEMARGEFPGGKGWSGAQAVPRLLGLRSDGSLRMEPVPELRQLRREEERLGNAELSGNALKLASRGRALELIADVVIPATGTSFGFTLLHADNDEEYTKVVFEPFRHRFIVDRSRASLSSLPHSMELEAYMDWKPGDKVRIHLLLDHSVLEVFANYEQCISTRVYPTLLDSTGVTAFASNGTVKLTSLRIWKLSSIWS